MLLETLHPYYALPCNPIVLTKFKNKRMKRIVSLMMLFALIVNAKDVLSKEHQIKSEEITYLCNGVTMKSYISYDAAQKGKRAAIVVVPEWWGINEYAKGRAKMLAEQGYIAIATDIYGEGKTADNPAKAQEYATPFYKDPMMAKERIEAAITELKKHTQTDPTKIAAIGYCFGGSMVLNAAKMGTPLKGVVSFHGGLATAPATKGSLKGKILVCHGAADKFISAEEVVNFRKNLDSTGTTYTFIEYPDATHAFTNPDATSTGKKFSIPISYNKAADEKSWKDMKRFFATIF